MKEVVIAMVWGATLWVMYAKGWGDCFKKIKQPTKPKLKVTIGKEEIPLHEN